MQGGGNVTQLSKTEQQRLGLPSGFRTVSPFPFAGMNRQASRMAIQDQQGFWVENYIKVGDGNLRAVPDVAPPLYTLPASDLRTMLCFSWFSIGLDDFCAMFFDDGSAIQVATGGATTTMAAASSGTFFQAGAAYPGTVGWGNQYLLICNNFSQNGYWAWDGSVLYGPGGISPQVQITSSGSSYVAAPTLTVFGGTGSGVSLSAVVVNGSVVQIDVVNPGSGYVPGDVVQVQFSGGGSDTGAELTASLTPTAVNAIVVLDGGTLYATPPTVVFTGGGGSGAAATASVSGGHVTSVTVTNGGSGYTSAPAISFTGGGGSGAVATATLVSSSIAAVNVVNGGTNYSNVPLLTFQGGFGGGAAATAVLSGPGPIVSVIVPVGGGGSGYTSLPAVTITDGGSGTGATAVVGAIVGGVIQSIIITNPGSDYTSPTVGFSGGGGSGATATAAVGFGSITSVTVTAAGSGYTAAPGVIVQSGVNAAASATLSLMPFGVSGTSIETYQSQVWVQDPFAIGTQPTGGVRQSSAAGSISDFATSSGGLTETVTARFLRRHLTAIRQSNGFLYPFGDSSANVISNVQVSGNPPTKTLNDQNTDPQTGTHWRDTLQDFSRTVLFANTFGVFGLFGGAVTKISGDMDLVFASARFPAGENPEPPTPNGAVTPTSAVANLYNRKVYLLLMNLLDPFTRAYRNAMVAWNEKEWSIISQSVDLAYIGTREHNSQLTAYGTNGRSLYPLMQVPSTDTQKVFASKLYGAAEPWKQNLARMLYVQAESFADPTRAPAFSVTVSTEYAEFASPDAPALMFPNPGQTLPDNASPGPSQSPLLACALSDIPGQELGFVIRSNDADHALYNLVMALDDGIGVFYA